MGLWRTQVGSELRARYFQPQCEPMRCLQQLDSGSYADDEVLVRSTGLARTLASAQSLLAGLYPPNATAAALDQGLPLGVQVAAPAPTQAPARLGHTRRSPPPSLHLTRPLLRWMRGLEGVLTCAVE